MIINPKIFKSILLMGVFAASGQVWAVEKANNLFIAKQSISSVGPNDLDTSELEADEDLQAEDFDASEHKSNKLNSDNELEVSEGESDAIESGTEEQAEAEDDAEIAQDLGLGSEDNS